MLKMYRLIMFFVILILVGCTQESSTTDSIVKDILESNPEADIFRFNDRIYQYNGVVETLEDSELSEVGEIKQLYKKNNTFEENMSTQLPVGSKLLVYSDSTNRDKLLVKTSDGYLSYIAEVEG